LKSCKSTGTFRDVSEFRPRQESRYFHRTATASRIVVFTIAFDASACRLTDVFQSAGAVFHGITDVLGRNSRAPADKCIIGRFQHIFCKLVHRQLL